MFLKSAGLTEFPGTIFMILKRPTKSKGALSACVGRGKQKGKVYILNRFVTLGWFHAVYIIRAVNLKGGQMLRHIVEFTALIMQA
jgi:hypothetical protein